MKTTIALLLTATAAFAQDWTLAGTLPDGLTPRAICTLGTDRLLILTKDTDPDGHTRALTWSAGAGFGLASSALVDLWANGDICTTGMPGTNFVYVAHAKTHFCRYNADTNAWSDLGFISGGFVDGASLSADEHHVYLERGEYRISPFTSFREYTPPESAFAAPSPWAEKAPFAGGRCAYPGSQIAWAGGDVIVAIIGWGNEMSTYSIAGDTWSEKTPIPGIAGDRIDGGSAMCADGTGEVYAFPGDGTANVLRYTGNWNIELAKPDGAQGLAGGPGVIYTIQPHEIWKHVTSVTPPGTSPSPSPSAGPAPEGGKSAGGCGGSAAAMGGLPILGLVLIILARK